MRRLRRPRRLRIRHARGRLLRRLLWRCGLLPGFAGLGMVNAAGWLWATHLIGWPSALVTALLGVVMTTALLDDGRTVPCFMPPPCGAP